MLIWNDETPGDAVVRALKEHVDQCKQELEAARIKCAAAVAARNVAEDALHVAKTEQKRRENDGKRD